MKRAYVHDVEPSFTNKNSYKSNKSATCGQDTDIGCWSFLRFIHIDVSFNVVYMIIFCLRITIEHYLLW
jgi:hypothetical protein